MINIYHNPRCSKSRQGVQFLEGQNTEFKIIKYLTELPSKEELKDIIKKLNISPINLIRTNEKVWKENFKGKTFSDDEIINIMLEHPRLIERPIIINDDKAVIGRPTEKILEIL